MTRRNLLRSFGVVCAIRLRAAGPPIVSLDENLFQRLASSRNGRPLLVDFWATWCAPCREELPKLVALHAKYKARGLDFITVSCDEPEKEQDALAFIRATKVPSPWYIRRVADDDHFINSVDPRWSGALPALFLYDQRGRLARSFIGETDLPILESAIASHWRE
jgi:thiol-disulfide isomerase/thioredoxin